jgi:hypothetical protein
MAETQRERIKEDSRKGWKEEREEEKKGEIKKRGWKARKFKEHIF